MEGETLPPAPKDVKVAPVKTDLECIQSIQSGRKEVVIPPIGNEFIAMTKDSAIVSVIGVQELLWRAQKVGQQYFHSMETLLVAAVFYWILTIVLQAIQSRIELRLARSER
jgi:polar amino acid transport system permease protein